MSRTRFLLLVVSGWVLVWSPLAATTKICCEVSDFKNKTTPTAIPSPVTKPFVKKPFHPITIPSDKTLPKKPTPPKHEMEDKKTKHPRPKPLTPKGKDRKPEYPEPEKSTSKTDDRKSKKIKPKPSTQPLRPLVSKKGDKDMEKAVWEINERRWPDRTVPFLFHPDFKKKYRPIVKTGLEKISNLTCVNFNDLTGRVAPDDSKEHKVVVQSRYGGCFATVGYNKMLKTSLFNVAPECFSPSGSVVLHEAFHTLGVGHTQSRYDRDKYISIHTDKILQGKDTQFKVRRDMYGKLSLVGLPYDYNSVMHYSLNAFAKDPNLQTMSLKKKFPGEVGSSLRLSRTDVATINRLYDCVDYYLGDDIQGAIPYKEWHKALTE